MQEKEFVVLFNIEENEETTVFIPQKVVKGIYNKKKKVFITDDGEILEHIISTDKNIGFAYRNDMSEDMTDELLDYTNSFNYEFSIQEYNGSLIPVITAMNNQVTEEINPEETEENYSFLYDRDILSFYLDNGFIDYTEIVYKTCDNVYPEIEERLIKLCEPNIKEIYEIITSKIKGQDDKIKEILGFIWKHYYDKYSYHNILVTGNKGVGKSTILKTIEENINIPCCRLTITQYGINITNGLKELLNKSNNDIEKAENGIIIIDDSENLTTEEGKYLNMYNSVQQDVITLINEGIFNISNDENNPLYFSTKNLFVIMAGNFSKVNPYTDKKVGISSYSNEDNFRKINDTNLENNFFSKFAKVIKLNDLTKNDYLDILKSSNGIIERTKKLYKINNATINISNDTLKYLAELSSKMPYGVITLNTLIEKALASITYEVAVNGSKKANVDISVNESGLLEASIKTPSKSKVRKR